MSQLNVVESFVVYDQSPAMFPGLTITNSGALLVSFSTVPDGLPGGEVHLIRSEDQGRTWSKPTLVANSQRPGGAAINAVGLTCTRNGTLLLAFNDVVTTNNFRDRNGRLYILHSTDEGATWQSSEQVTPEILEAGTYGNFIELDDGTLIGTVWGRWKTEERWRSTALFSRDGGVTWGEPTTIAYDPNARLHSEYANSEQSGFGKDGQVDPEMFSKPTFRPHSPIDGFNETSLIKLPDGRIRAHQSARHVAVPPLRAKRSIAAGVSALRAGWSTRFAAGPQHCHQRRRGPNVAADRDAARPQGHRLHRRISGRLPGTGQSARWQHPGRLLQLRRGSALAALLGSQYPPLIRTVGPFGQ